LVFREHSSDGEIVEKVAAALASPAGALTGTTAG
jgi:hypothetical protein